MASDNFPKWWFMELLDVVVWAIIVKGIKGNLTLNLKIWKVKPARFGNIRSLLFTIAKSQGDFNCGASSQADFILNYFLSNFLKFPLKFSISSQPSWQAGTIKATLLTNKNFYDMIWLWTVPLQTRNPVNKSSSPSVPTAPYSPALAIPSRFVVISKCRFRIGVNQHRGGKTQ